MTPQEKTLIQGVFDRLAAQQGARDPEAENFIRAQVAGNAGAAYGLVQAVVMLEAGLNQAQARIADLQKQLEQGQAAGGGSFLAGASPWGNGSVPRSAPQPAYGAPPQPANYPQPAPAASPWAQPAGGGSFLRNAATMAAGVAGGTLIAEGLTSLLGGHHYGGYGGFGGGFGGGYGGPGEVVENVTVNNYYDNQASAQTDYDQASVQDASYDVDDSGSFDDGVDI